MLGSEALYTAEQTRALDRSAIEDHGIPGIILMARAAEAAFEHMLEIWADVRSIAVVCGTGNNGGDGYLVADLAHKRALRTTVLQVGDAQKIAGDALLARKQALDNGVNITAWSSAEASVLAEADVVVDALLGTGLAAEVREEFAAVISAINAVEGAVLSIDVPSGLNADTGRILGTAVKADLTVSFIGLNRGLFTLDGTDCSGAVTFSDLGVPLEAYEAVPAKVSRLDLDTLLECMPARPSTAHKGVFGSVLVVGGDHGMGGAAAMAAEAALRCGAGLVRVATRSEHVAPILSRRPEVMVSGVEDSSQYEPLLNQTDVLVVGPGLGQSDWSSYLLRAALSSGKPVVLDADALNLLAGEWRPDDAERANWILTPHPGEAARLLDCTTAEVQSDRFSAARDLQSRFGGVVVLKGNGTLIATPTEIGLSDYGNPGMASGGMGDVLSGVLGALLAVGLSAELAAALGVCLHGAAADRAAAGGEHGLLATDLMPFLREMLG